MEDDGWIDEKNINNKITFALTESTEYLESLLSGSCVGEKTSTFCGKEKSKKENFRESL